GSDGTIYVGSNDGKVYVLRSDGTLRSAFDIGDNVESSPVIATDGTIYVGSNDEKLYAIDPTDNPRNIKDKYCTYEDLTADGVVVNSTTNWLNGSITKGPWAVRMEVIRSTEANADGKYEYTLKTWIRQCDDSNCANILGTYFADTRIGYAAKDPHLEQTIELSEDDHNKFDRFLFGLTEATGGATQVVTITDLQFSFIRSGDAVITTDPEWP
ncbi:MAG: PQQ-binding-like beta-propeller repeat protein, partial [Thermodesulfobacteriota bacterium]|nr:PQQ-binding-like beta-propeller repeat protein [Thermodesulfobacteriota bacterium]